MSLTPLIDSYFNKLKPSQEQVTAHLECINADVREAEAKFRAAHAPLPFYSNSPFYTPTPMVLCWAKFQGKFHLCVAEYDVVAKTAKAGTERPLSEANVSTRLTAWEPDNIRSLFVAYAASLARCGAIDAIDAEDFCIDLVHDEEAEKSQLP